MDLYSFSEELAGALKSLGPTVQIDSFDDDPTLHWRVVIRPELFLNVFFNASTGKIAIALILNNRRAWGIDNDKIRSWHRHPVENPSQYVKIEPLTVTEIVDELRRVLASIEI